MRAVLVRFTVEGAIVATHWQDAEGIACRAWAPGVVGRRPEIADSEVTITIKLDGVLAAMAHSAACAKSRKCTALSGAIVAVAKRGPSATGPLVPKGETLPRPKLTRHP